MISAKNLRLGRTGTGVLALGAMCNPHLLVQPTSVGFAPSVDPRFVLCVFESVSITHEKSITGTPTGSAGGALSQRAYLMVMPGCCVDLRVTLSQPLLQLDHLRNDDSKPHPNCGSGPAGAFTHGPCTGKDDSQDIKALEEVYQQMKMFVR